MWRERLRDMALDALSRVCAYHEWRESYEQVRKAARRQLELDPWREAAHRQLMRALHLSGERTAALAQYQRCRRILAEELGVEPEEETQALYERIRMARPGTLAVSGRGSAPTWINNLPEQPTPFIGRERELAEIADLLSDPGCRLLTLTGPGGIGKTRLALQAARQQVELFSHGACFVSLAPVRSVELLAPAIAESFGLALYGREPPQEQFIEHLRDQERLMVLDNFEHLLDGTPLITAILRRAPHTKIVVTSRERLNVQGEWVFEVEGLGVPKDLESEDFEAHSAVKLFLQTARRYRPRLGIEAGEREYVARICRLVGGVPLGIELAAAWYPTLSCGEIAEEIEKNLDFLATSLQDVPERHRSIRAAFDHSWNLLSEEERSVFRRLSVFRGGFHRAAAEDVAGASLLALSALLSKSFVHRNAAERYDLHELLRQYAEDKLRQDPSDHELTRDRHCEYYLRLLREREEDLRGRNQREALEEVGQEIGNVRSAWSWAIQKGKLEPIASAADSLWLFYATGHGRFWEGAEAFGSVAAALEQKEDSGREHESVLAKALTRQASFCYRLGLYDEAKSLLRRSTQLSRRVGDRRETAFALNHLAAVTHLLGAYEEEECLLEESIALFRSAGDHWGSAYSLNDLAMASHLLGDSTAARKLSDESLGIFGRLGDRRGAAFALSNLGVVAAHLGQYDDAIRLYQESLSLRRETGDQWGVASSLAQLGAASRATGAFDQSRLYLQESLRTALDGRAMPVVLDALVELAALLIDEGEGSRALAILRATLRHPASNKVARDRAEGLLRELGAEPEVRQAPDSEADRTIEDLSEEHLRTEADIEPES